MKETVADGMYESGQDGRIVTMPENVVGVRPAKPVWKSAAVWVRGVWEGSYEGGLGGGEIVQASFTCCASCRAGPT